ILLLITTILGITCTAARSDGQTPPPASGDWIITDSTTFANQQITITGDVLVQGNGHLSLTNVNLRFTGSGGQEVRVTTNARLTISGGSITSSGRDLIMTLGGNSAIDGCSISNTTSIAISTWKAKVTNNTINGSRGDGIRFIPSDSPIRAADISNNRITDSGWYGINISIADFGTSDVKLVCVGNNVSGSLMDGIHAYVIADRGTFLFQSNELYKNMGDGLYANLRVRVVEFRLDDIRAHNNTDTGVYVSSYSSNMLAKYMYRVTSIGNGGEGVHIDFQNQHWANPVFRNWYVWDNEGGGIQFRNFMCATLENSYCVNNLSQTDYSVVNTNLEIYKTTHRKGAGSVSGGAYMITSFRSLNFHATWQNGLPCSYNTVEFEDSGGNRLFVFT
ncbi:MAG: right-handed parallel beta-helix repeat-containing protein, partial [Thermoplasmata archaeon]|nr:right-handed parallel beta-helix repeat-containing protein [Thermoplasmata archaeon]